MELVSSESEIAVNLSTFDSYRLSEDSEYRAFFSKRLRLGKQFVYANGGKHTLFAPSRFAGYKDCTMERHIAFPDKDGKRTTPQISKFLGKAKSDNEAEVAYLALCAQVGVTASDWDRTYWRIDSMLIESRARLERGEAGYPDEVAEYVEGATKRVVVNAHERNPKAREACLAHYGYNCSICTFNFKARFGVIGERFMHVHHLFPIAKADQPRLVDPLLELRPVCPNCHAMLHRTDPPFSIEELKAILSRESDA